tara:strand:- start:601 stop:960 length:360 start_codon:yes stop_codon:yes gene_type:complete
MKIGVNFSIDVTKLDKTRFKPGKYGAKYCDLTCFISPEEPDDYGQHGGIKHSTTAEERAAGTEMNFVGNATAFWGEGISIVKKDGSMSSFGAPVKPVKPVKKAAKITKTLEEFDNDTPF